MTPDPGLSFGHPHWAQTGARNLYLSTIMKSFIRQTAEHYAQQRDLGRTFFIFPNHRSLLHFRSEYRKVSGGGKVRGASINDFFQKVADLQTTDRIRLLLALYECYSRLNDKAEPLDEFIHWGSVMLSDFDNIDKYLVDASKLFVNVSDFRAIQDTYQYLTEGQRQAIDHFLAHFRDRSGRVTVNMDGVTEESVKSRFLQVWNLLGPLYEAFNDLLAEREMAYEGRIYRAFATAIKENIDIKDILSHQFDGVTRFVFVGLNALNECEKTVLRAMRDRGMTEFVWDYSSAELKDPRNKASFFLRRNVEEFPQAFPLDVEAPRGHRANVRVVSVPSSVGQTKLAPQILEEVRCSAPEDTVFVLPDETLLMPLLSAIPAGYDTVNITMGYPMERSAVYALLKDISMMHLGMRVKDGEVAYHHKSVHNIFSSSLFRAVIGEKEQETVDRVREKAKQYIPATDLAGTPVLDTLFRPVSFREEGADSDSLLGAAVASARQNHALEQALLNDIALLNDSLKAAVQAGSEVSVQADMELEFASRYASAVTTLSDIDLKVMPGTYLRLLDGLVRGESVPFEGDALEGLQVMGTLETRALDFRNVVIMSANEELFPHRSADNSFIPPELRKGFGLPTLEYQDAVWAYYFYRLIQRAENVWLIYDSRTEGLLSGEESRYVKQLEYHFHFPLKRFTAVAPVSPLAEEEFIPKTQEDIDAVRRGHLSASSLQSYLYCQTKFYYQAVKGLKAEDEVTESLDASMIGTIFHGVMEQLYSGTDTVTAQMLDTLLQGGEDQIRAMIRQGICEKMRSDDVEGRNLVIEEVILEYVKGTLRHDLRLLRESGSQGFRILGLERYMRTTIDGFPFIGFVDRIDTYKPGELRIVDYKTGHVEDDDILITDANAQAVVDKLFGESNTGRPKIALQLFLYGLFAHEGLVRDAETVVNSIYSTSKILTSPLPDVPESPVFSSLMKERLHGLLTEIADTSRPFRRTQDRHTCALCDFRSICGR